MRTTFRAVVVGLCACLVGFGFAACGGGSGDDADRESAGVLGSGLELLPDEPALRRHVLVANLDRLRQAYPGTAAYEEALGGVWFPGALSAARESFARGSFGLELGDVESFATAGFHPAEVTVANGDLAPSGIGPALARLGYAKRGDWYARGADGEIDVGTPAGRLALASLDRIALAPGRMTTASTTTLLRAAVSPRSSLGQRPEFAAVAKALDPVTAAIVLDAALVRPPYGAPTRIVPRHAAQLVGVGIDDAGPRERKLKIALIYVDEDEARDDAEVIERELGTIDVPGLPGSRFTDIASEWQLTRTERAIVITASLPGDESPGLWRDLVERGDVAAFVRPATAPP